jgi:hypothetical protein
MIMRLLPFRMLCLFAASAALLGALALFGVRPAYAAGEMNFQVQLIWGTDGERPKDKPLQEVDPKLQDKLKAVFKWKNYFDVAEKTLSIPKDGSQKLKLSDKCEIQVQDLGGSRIEIRLFGEGKFVVKKVQAVAPGEVIVLAGDGKDKTAWFVVLTPK